MSQEYTHTFSFDIGQKVVVDGTSVKGVVAGLFVSKHGTQDIYIEYVDSNGVVRGEYFTAKELSLLAK